MEIVQRTLYSIFIFTAYFHSVSCLIILFPSSFWIIKKISWKIPLYSQNTSEYIPRTRTFIYISTVKWSKSGYLQLNIFHLISISISNFTNFPMSFFFSPDYYLIQYDTLLCFPIFLVPLNLEHFHSHFCLSRTWYFLSGLAT